MTRFTVLKYSPEFKGEDAESVIAALKMIAVSPITVELKTIVEALDRGVRVFAIEFEANGEYVCSVEIVK